MKIQEITVSEPDQMILSVDLVIADAAVDEQTTEVVTARVQIERRGMSLENVQLAALDRVQECIEHAHDIARKTHAKLE